MAALGSLAMVFNACGGGGGGAVASDDAALRDYLGSTEAQSDLEDLAEFAFYSEYLQVAPIVFLAGDDGLYTDNVDENEANEYADVTIEKGTEASSITDRDKAKEGGWTRSSGFFGWGKRKGDVDAANRAGNVSIALGEQLGGSSQKVVGEVKQVGTQYGLGFENKKGIDEIVKKEYVDTSKLADVKTFDEARQEKGFFGAIKQMKENQDIYNEIADASKKKGQKESTATTES